MPLNPLQSGSFAATIKIDAKIWQEIEEQGRSCGRSLNVTYVHDPGFEKSVRDVHAAILAHNEQFQVQLNIDRVKAISPALSDLQVRIDSFRQGLASTGAVLRRLCLPFQSIAASDTDLARIAFPSIRPARLNDSPQLERVERLLEELVAKARTQREQRATVGPAAKQVPAQKRRRRRGRPPIDPRIMKMYRERCASSEVLPTLKKEAVWLVEWFAKHPERGESRVPKWTTVRFHISGRSKCRSKARSR